MPTRAALPFNPFLDSDTAAVVGTGPAPRRKLTATQAKALRLQDSLNAARRGVRSSVA